MSTASELYRAIARQQRGDVRKQMSEFRSGRIVGKPWLNQVGAIKHYADLLTAIREFLPTAGWLCFQSGIQRYGSTADLLNALGDVFSDERGLGRLMYGELTVTGGGKSLHIRQDGYDGWLLTHLYEAEDSAEEQGVLESVRFIAMPEQEDDWSVGDNVAQPVISLADKLCYQLYRRYDPEQGYVLVSSRFTGFETVSVKEDK